VRGGVGVRSLTGAGVYSFFGEGEASLRTNALVTDFLLVLLALGVLAFFTDSFFTFFDFSYTLSI
jgi:hypothetical protein